MDFEETLYNIMIEIAINNRQKFIDEYGEEDQLSKFNKAYFNEWYKDISKMALRGSKKLINCGGYALKVGLCFFPNGDRFSNYVSSLLNTFDFIRLLGDEPLQDDEYLVFFRFNNYNENDGKNNGHHFIRVDDDGLVVDKCGAETPRIFPGWKESFLDSPEAVFAVKKNHRDYLDDVKCMWGKDAVLQEGLDFEQSAIRAIKERSNLFIYHCHTFNLKKSKDGDIFITDANGDIVADLLTEDKETIVVTRAGKEEYVENLSGPVAPVIKNGRLVNFSEFKKRRNREDIER